MSTLRNTAQATLGGVPLFTAKQWLQRWRGPQLSAEVALQRLLEAAGMTDEAGEQALGALGVLLGTTSAPVAVAEQVDALVAVLSGLAARRSLILVVEDAEHLESSSQARTPSVCPPVCVWELRT